MRFSDLEKGRSEPGDCGRSEDSRPEWLDLDMFNRALEVYKDNVYSVMLAHGCGPVIVGQVSTLVLPVIFTGKSATVPLACRRLANTVHHVLAWYDGNIWDKEDYAHESVLQIRRLHRSVVERMTSAGEVPPDGHVWLSQLDMALTQFAFMGPVILSADKIGMKCSERDLECLLHFWRGVGYLQGMEDRFNICAGNFRETKMLFQEIVDHVVVPTLSEPKEEYQKMVLNGVLALKSHSFMIETSSFVNFSYDLVGHQQKQPMTLYGWVCNWIRVIYITMLSIDWIRRYTNRTGENMLRGTSNRLRKAYSAGPKKSSNGLFCYLGKIFADAKQYFEV